MAVAASVVLYHPDFRVLTRPLEVLAQWPHGPVLVHLNDATDDVLAKVRALLPQATVSGSPGNLGFSGGHNRLLAEAFTAGADAVVVHNPDLILAPSAVDALTTTSQQYDGRALLGPALQLADATDWAPEGRVDTLGIGWTASGRHLDRCQGDPWRSNDAGPERVAGISGACLYVPRPAYELIVRVSGEFFDEDFVAYREDAELAFRAALLGVPSYLVPAATGLHARGSRGTTRGRSAHIDRLGVRNRFLIAFKYGRRRPGRLPQSVLRDLVVLGGVLLRERSSLSGVAEAWRLRQVMQVKGDTVLAAATVSSRAACGL